MLLLAWMDAGDLPLLPLLREGVASVLRMQDVGDRAVSRVLPSLVPRTPGTWLPSHRDYDDTRSVWGVPSRRIRTSRMCKTERMGFGGRRKGETYKARLNRVSLPPRQPGDLGKGEDKENYVLNRAKYRNNPGICSRVN